VERNHRAAVAIVMMVFFISFSSLFGGLSEKMDYRNSWSMYMHDSTHTGRSHYLGPRGDPHILWMRKLADYRTWFVSPVIDSEGNVWIGGRDKVYKVDSGGNQL